MTVKVERGVAIHWYLDLHWLASERSVTQQVCEVSLSEVRLGVAGRSDKDCLWGDKPRSGWSYIQLRAKGLSSAEVSLGVEVTQPSV